MKGIVAEDHDVDDNHSEFQHLHGVSVIHDPSLTSCGDTFYTFQTDVMCDESIESEGEAEFVSLTRSGDSCDFILTLKHASGCPYPDLYHYGMLVEDNEWVIGLIDIVFGLFIGLIGTRAFQFVAAASAGALVFIVVSLYAAFFDFISGTAGVVLGIIVALVIAILVSLIVYFVIWIAIGVLGMAAGITVALFIYNLCFIDYAWADYWVPMHSQ